MRPCQNIDPSKLKVDVEAGQCHYYAVIHKIVNEILQLTESCRKCQGKVYDMERITLKSGIWHRQCFTCEGIILITRRNIRSSYNSLAKTFKIRVLSRQIAPYCVKLRHIASNCAILRQSASKVPLIDQ